MNRLGIAAGALFVACVFGGMIMGPGSYAETFEGKFIAGEGDVEYLELLNNACRLFYPDPEFQNISMLYNPTWNGFVEGPTWGAWWIQNSYGPSYCALPFFVEPYITFLQNSQDLWFNLMGDGKRVGEKGWVGPDGCLCDAAGPNLIYYKQGDGKIDIHDWGMEFTAAGVVLQSELLLISRDKAAIGRYLPKLERSANFIESRRDPKNNLFLAGPAGNLLAPSYAAWKKPDGTYDKAYLTGLSITYIAALDRLIELEKMMGDSEKANYYAERRDLAKKGLPLLTTDEGYFVKYMDPDGTKHGVYGAKEHGYFEAICNHDAIAFRVADDKQARKIYDKIVSIPGLRPHDVIITNYPGLDDMYEPSTSWLWSFGTWVNGGHWTTCEARMIMGYYQLGAYEDARRSMQHIMGFVRQFRMDNNLVEFGAKPYQPKEPINCVYDTWGAPAALIRGLFEYQYRAEGLTLLPHIPPGITKLEQRFPIRFGDKKFYLLTMGGGDISSVTINFAPYDKFDAKSVSLTYDAFPDSALIVIMMGLVKPPERVLGESLRLGYPAENDRFWNLAEIFPDSQTGVQPLRIGADSNGKNMFLGQMRRVRLFNRALEPDEIANLAKTQDAAFPEGKGPVADYAMDKIVDGLIQNNVGGGLNAKVVGDVQIDASGPAPEAVFAGNGSLEVAYDPKLALVDAFTLEAYICPGKLPDSGARIIDRLTAGKDDGFLLDTCPGNSLRAITEMGTVAYDAKLVPERWVHVAVTFDKNGELRLFLQGAKVAGAAAKKQAPTVALAPIIAFHRKICALGMQNTYEARHAAIALDYFSAMHMRKKMLEEGTLKKLPDVSQAAADKSYVDTMYKLAGGLQRVLESYEESDDPAKKKIAEIWDSVQGL